MNNFVVSGSARPQDPQSYKFGLVAFATVALGVGFAIWVICRFRPPAAPPPVVVESPPEIRVVREPAPPPEVIIKEVPRIDDVPTFTPPLEPAPLSPKAVSGWAGVWRKGKDALPIFQIKGDGLFITGTCMPNWGTHFPILNAKMIGNDLEFVVEDGIIRIHVRMSKTGENKARLENWITEDDWVESVMRANMTVKTIRQALLYRQILEENAKLRGKPVTVGRFIRTPSTSDEEDSQWATPPPDARPPFAPQRGILRSPLPGRYP